MRLQFRVPAAGPGTRAVAALNHPNIMPDLSFHRLGSSWYAGRDLLAQLTPVAIVLWAYKFEAIAESLSREHLRTGRPISEIELERKLNFARGNKQRAYLPAGRRINRTRRCGEDGVVRQVEAFRSEFRRF